MVSMQHEIHADAMLLRAMNANATDVELARCCAQTVGAIDADAHGGGGGSKATVLTVVEQTEGALAALEAASALQLPSVAGSAPVFKMNTLYGKRYRLWRGTVSPDACIPIRILEANDVTSTPIHLA